MEIAAGTVKAGAAEAKLQKPLERMAAQFLGVLKEVRYIKQETFDMMIYIMLN